VLPAVHLAECRRFSSKADSFPLLPLDLLQSQSAPGVIGDSHALTVCPFPMRD
jgi:hypothetical protein